jgi:hypothetical protein
MRESRCMSLLPRTTLHSDSEQYQNHRKLSYRMVSVNHLTLFGWCASLTLLEEGRERLISWRVGGGGQNSQPLISHLNAPFLSVSNKMERD